MLSWPSKVLCAYDVWIEGKSEFMTGFAQGYAGDVTPEEAWQRLSDDATAVIIDVRTQAEWHFVGVPDLSSLGKEPLLVQWVTSHGPNPDFMTELMREFDARDVATDAPLLFLCRSGVRSKNAAIACTQAGYTACFNVATGFEGDLDDAHHRSTVNGWRVAGLPWAQS